MAYHPGLEQAELTFGAVHHLSFWLEVRSNSAQIWELKLRQHFYMVFGHNGNRLIFPPLSSLRFHLRRELPTQGIKLINDRVYNNFPLKTLCDIIHSISDFYITTFPCINSSSQLQDDIGCVLPIAWDSFPTSFAKNFDPCFLSLSHSIFLQKQSLRF